MNGRRCGDRVFQLEIFPVIAHPLAAPQQFHNVEALLEPRDWITVVNGVHGSLVLGESGADSELEAPSRQMIRGDCDLGQQCGMPIQHPAH